MTAMANPTEYRDASGFIAEIIRTNRRKSADIRVEEGAVSIVVPSETPLEKIDQLLASKRRWIKEKMALHQLAAPASSREFVSGEAFPYLGRNYRLKIETGAFAPVKLVHGRLLITLPSGPERPHMVRNALVRWYKRQAEQKIKEKVTRFAPIVGVSPMGVGIRTFKSRWGSCTTKGKLEFNWQIMMAPNRMVDYVVMHELCHLIRHDHSSEFWNELGRVMPDYPQCREWLRENAERVGF
ncbi:M48 family metallopeptidase [Vreelandella titanicae]|uniref:M48 family metallopeptidase n=1 Tax=Vreelandella titanicae TaxID=664683 RepID=UPI0023574115|nr:SprT family zinc-dependent metalloprotease [Halomonas sp.]|tara:strand:- start:330 stop:1049 length:720 start_codon:yes stop_codon:yes gene_type:complete